MKVSKESSRILQRINKTLTGGNKVDQSESKMSPQCDKQLPMIVHEETQLGHRWT